MLEGWYGTVTFEDTCSAATGLTNGDLLKGLDYYADGARTNSIMMRGLTGTVREITAFHRISKLERISSISDRGGEQLTMEDIQHID